MPQPRRTDTNRAFLSRARKPAESVVQRAEPHRDWFPQFAVCAAAAAVRLYTVNSNHLRDDLCHCFSQMHIVFSHLGCDINVVLIGGVQRTTVQCYILVAF